MKNRADDQEELVEIYILDLTYMPGIGVVLDAFPAKVPKSEAPVQPAPAPTPHRLPPRTKTPSQAPTQIGAVVGIAVAIALHFSLGWEWPFTAMMAILWFMPLGAAIGHAWSRELRS